MFIVLFSSRPSPLSDKNSWSNAAWLVLTAPSPRSPGRALLRLISISRRMESIRDIHGATIGIVCVLLAILPCVDNAWENHATTLHGINVRSWPRDAAVHTVEWARVTLVEIHVCECGGSFPGLRSITFIASLVDGDIEDVGTHIPPAEGVQVPV